MRQEPELAHPFNRTTSVTSSSSKTSFKVSSKEKAHAKSLRNAGKEVGAVVRAREQAALSGVYYCCTYMHR